MQQEHFKTLNSEFSLVKHKINQFKLLSLDFLPYQYDISQCNKLILSDSIFGETQGQVLFLWGIYLFSFLFWEGELLILRSSSGKSNNQFIQYQMSSYKQKIQKQLKKAITRFQKQRLHPFKAHPIQKNQKLQKAKSKSKRIFKPVCNYFQRIVVQNQPPTSHLFNFYNIITIDESALQSPHGSPSYIKNIFYTKTSRKIEVHQNYLIFQLTDSCVLNSQVSQTLQRYRNSSNPKLQHISILLQKLEEKLCFKGVEGVSDVSITQDAYRLFDSLGKTMFISKIAWQKLVISKSVLQLCQWNINQFIFQSLVSKIPFLQGPKCLNYYEIIIKQIQNYSKILDFLQGTIPLTSLAQFSKMKYLDYIFTRTNMQHQCLMSLSMPIPLVELITIDQVLYSRQSSLDSISGLKQQLKRLRTQFDRRAHCTLQYLVDLPENRLPVNECKVASYIQRAHFSSNKLQDIDTKTIEKSSYDSQSCKNQQIYQF